jgi:hypothetical protein
MRFIVMHKAGPRYFANQVEKREIFEMGAFIQASIKEGTFLNGAGLSPAAPRTHLSFKGGKLTRSDGALAGANELVAGLALLKVADREEAIAWARRFAQVIDADCELELGRVTEAWDLGLSPRPEGKVAERYLLVFLANEASESGAPPSEREQREMDVLLTDLSRAGVLELVEGIKPSREGTRLQFKAGRKVTTLDGPFAETKECIAGFSIIQVPTREEALAWAERYGRILTDLEVDVLALHDTSPAPKA